MPLDITIRPDRARGGECGGPGDRRRLNKQGTAGPGLLRGNDQQMMRMAIQNLMARFAHQGLQFSSREAVRAFIKRTAIGG